MKKYSLSDGIITERESPKKHFYTLDECYKEILRRDEGQEKEDFDETLISIDLACGAECTSADCINDATDTQKTQIYNIIRSFILREKNSRMPYIVYRKSGAEHICCECTLYDDHAEWRILRAHDISSMDISYLVKVMQDLKIYQLDKFQ